MLETPPKKEGSLQTPNPLKVGDREEDIKVDQTLNEKIAPTGKKEITVPTEIHLAKDHQTRTLL